MASIIKVQPSKRLVLLKQVNDVFIEGLDHEEDWRQPNKAEAKNLVDFLSDNYIGAPKKMWRVRVGTRIGYDNEGVYIHEAHHRRYFGLPREKASAVILQDNSEAVPLFDPNPGTGTDSTGNYLKGMLREVPALTDSMRYKVLQACFKRADRNSNGLLSRPELGQVLRKVIHTLKSAQVEEIMRNVDEDGDGNVNYEEFVGWLEKNANDSVAQNFVWSIKDEADIVKATFRMWDRDGDGLIQNTKLCKALGKIFPNSTEKKLQALTDVIDTDNSGDIDYDEFVDFLFFRHKKPQQA